MPDSAEARMALPTPGCSTEGSPPQPPDTGPHGASPPRPSPPATHTVTHLASGSYSAQILLNSSRWWGPRMDQSRVR